MTHMRALGFAVWCWLMAVTAQAQEMTPTPPPAPSDAPASATSDVPPPPPADAAPTVPEPPPGYVQASGSVQVSTAGAPAAAPAPSDRQPSDPEARRRFNIWLGLGFGDAVGCGNEDPDSPCAVDGAVALTLAGDFRFYPHFSVGLEASVWGFAVSDQWLGQLDGMQKSADTSMSYLAAFGRWYWFDKGIIDPYVQLGLGFGGMGVTVTNEAGDTYNYSAGGASAQLGLGAEFHVHRAIRLGPQLLMAALFGNQICEKLNDGKQVCRDPEKNDKGEQEGNALAWRFLLVGTIMLGDR